MIRFGKAGWTGEVDPPQQKDMTPYQIGQHWYLMNMDIRPFLGDNTPDDARFMKMGWEDEARDHFELFEQRK
jgi:hypothetical protein